MTSRAIWLRIFCATLLLSLGFAHKPLYAHPSADPASSYYLLPDGTFASLCIDDVDHGKPTKSSLRGGCDACRLTSGILLPGQPADHTPASCGHRDIDFPSRFSALGRAIPRPGSPVRGPPSSFV